MDIIESCLGTAWTRWSLCPFEFRNSVIPGLLILPRILCPVMMNDLGREIGRFQMHQIPVTSASVLSSSSFGQRRSNAIQEGATQSDMCLLTPECQRTQLHHRPPSVWVPLGCRCSEELRDHTATAVAAAASRAATATATRAATAVMGNVVSTPYRWDVTIRWVCAP